jgi:N4-gp56 family major capsid protein
MAITHFIPALWEAKMLERWENEKVFAQLLDRHYEGIATKGNTVHISGVVKPAIKDYKAAGRTTSADAITDTGVDLLIDQEKNFDFYVDDIDAVQAAGSLADYTDAAGDALVEDADQFIANMLFVNGTLMPYTAPTTGDDAFNVFRLANKMLTKNKVPRTGRVAAINPEFAALLLGADSKLTAVDTSGDNDGLRNGTIGQLLRFRVVESNNTPNDDHPQAAFFHPQAAAYVSQIDKVEALRADNRIADRMRGLHVYGGKVVRKEGVLIWNQGGS